MRQEPLDNVTSDLMHTLWSSGKVSLFLPTVASGIGNDASFNQGGRAAFTIDWLRYNFQPLGGGWSVRTRPVCAVIHLRLEEGMKGAPSLQETMIREMSHSMRSYGN